MTTIEVQFSDRDTGTVKSFRARRALGLWWGHGRVWRGAEAFVEWAEKKVGSEPSPTDLVTGSAKIFRPNGDVKEYTFDEPQPRHQMLGVIIESIDNTQEKS
ncbi:hypothetical protein SEA_RASPUTIA_24 [Microbacterium phage Rasputia]|nr:hypothetical protein SEA_RASPUTIA_24 [Microbacterium phage Rasputia]